MKEGLGSWREARGGNDKLREKWVWKDTWEDEGKLSREGGEGELGPGREGIGWKGSEWQNNREGRELWKEAAMGTWGKVLRGHRWARTEEEQKTRVGSMCGRTW